MIKTAVKSQNKFEDCNELTRQEYRALWDLAHFGEEGNIAVE